MVIYKITDLKKNLIYVGKKQKDYSTYYGSGTIITFVIRKRIKEYIELKLNKYFDEKKINEYKIKYGQILFKKEILEFCNTPNELKDREEYWIKKLDATNPKIGYNILPNSTTNDTWNYITEKKRAEIKIKLRKKLGKKVYQYDLDGNFIKKYDSIRQAAYENNLYTSNIQKACIGQIKYSGKFIWKFYKTDKINFSKNELIKIKKEYNKFIKRYNKVCKYNLNGNFIKEYNSIQEAAYENNINRSNIRKCCNKKITHSGNFIWKYKKDIL